MFYVSRFARPLSKRDLANIHETALRNNRRERITGFLVCLGDTFFQVLEGPARNVERIYFERIVKDARHRDVICLKTDNAVRHRMFPDWNMKVFNLNEPGEALPFAFRQMLSALLESSHTVSQYTQPTVVRMMRRGLNPTHVRPVRKRVTVLYSDIIGFSHFAEHLKPQDMLELVNSHIEVCAQSVGASGGEVNKLTGDGVLAYFSDRTTDTAIESALSIVKEMRRRRARARKDSAHRLLYGGVGLGNGTVYEGNVGPVTKRDFTILGNTVNRTARLESMTRDLNVRLAMDASVVRRANRAWPFVSLGKHQLKGQSRSLEVFTIRTLPHLDVPALYERIKTHVRQSLGSRLVRRSL